MLTVNNREREMRGKNRAEQSKAEKKKRKSEEKKGKRGEDILEGENCCTPFKQEAGSYG